VKSVKQDAYLDVSWQRRQFWWTYSSCRVDLCPHSGHSLHIVSTTAKIDKL